MILFGNAIYNWREMQLSKEDMAVVMNLVDVDKDGICSLDDFRTFVSKNLDAKNKVQAT